MNLASETIFSETIFSETIFKFNSIITNLQTLILFHSESK